MNRFDLRGTAIKFETDPATEEVRMRQRLTIDSCLAWPTLSNVIPIVSVIPV